MKKLLILIVSVLALIVMPKDTYAKSAESKVTIYFFRGYDCVHCEGSLEFINEHKDDIPENVEIVTYEVWKNDYNNKLHLALKDKFNIVDDDNRNAVPFLVVGDTYKIGMDGTIVDFEEMLEMANKYTSGEKEYKDIVSETANELKKENKDIKFKAIKLEDLYKDNTVVTIIVFVIFGLVVVGFIGLIAFSRKN